MKFKKAASFGAVVAIALAGVAFVAAPANAEPTTPTGGYALAGSDTIQDVVNALVNGTNVTGSFVQVKTSGVPNASFDAFPNTGSGSYIQTKSGSQFKYFLRPSGSGDGINSMIASYNLKNNGFQWSKTGTQNLQSYVDIARSSGGPKTLDSNQSSPAASDIAFVPFARDAVSYAYVEDASWTQGQKDAVAALTGADLKNLYDGTQPIAGVTLRPLLPQSSSGTRKFFLGNGGGTGLGYPNNNRPAGVAAIDETKQENVATELSAAGVGAVIPFSAAGWIAQSNGAVPFNSITAANTALGATGVVKLGNPLAGSTTVFTGTTTLAPTSGYYSNSTWGRNTYLVTALSALSGDAKLTTLLNPTNTTASSLAGYGSLPSTPGAVKTKFGFLAPSTTTVVYALSSDTY
ncbi:hypothetical protein [uncultured Microbacterium sp.]|uniref:hypothetical protein n=1 Tax=uncultured Microbacterium sp. TaxID=191216 RepID=UPI0035CA5BAC